MSYKLDFTKDALKGIDKLKQSGDKQVLNKLASFYKELEEHPRTGTGQIEILKHYEEETYSRRINREHRLVYRVYDETVTVFILSTHGHY
jgi:toxin YoeB